MKNILIIALLVLQAACSSTPPKEGDANYSTLNESLIAINSVNHNNAINYNNEEIHKNLVAGINEGWPDLKLAKNTETISSAYTLNIEALSYNASFDKTTSVETLSNKTNYYNIYKTKTFLGFKYNITDRETNKVVWSKEVESIVANQNKKNDICHSSSLLKDLACNTIVEPFLETTPDAEFSAIRPPSTDYQPATEYNEMFIKAGRDIANTLPDPQCSSDGYSTCIAHFFRNTLGF